LSFRIDSLEAQVVLSEQALKTPSRPNLIIPNEKTILPPSPKNNTLRNLKKGEEVRTSQRVVVEMIQRQRDELQELKKKTSEHKELHQELLLNLHQDVMRGVEKSSGLLCSPAKATIATTAFATTSTSLEEDGNSKIYPNPSDSTHSDCRSRDRGDDDRPVMLTSKVAQGKYAICHIIKFIFIIYTLLTKLTTHSIRTFCNLNLQFNYLKKT